MRGRPETDIPFSANSSRLTAIPNSPTERQRPKCAHHIQTALQDLPYEELKILSRPLEAERFLLEYSGLQKVGIRIGGENLLVLLLSSVLGSRDSRTQTPEGSKK